ncbi:MAG: hypothetical protein ACRDHZ_01950 [Ktedonobacteraceae bacterium]
MDTNQQDSWVFTLLGEHSFQRQQGFFPWWYRLTSPPEIENPTLAQRDVARRSKILSALALFLALLLLLVVYIALTGPNKQIITTVYILYPTIFLCLVLNRFRHLHLAGLLLILAMVGGMYLTLSTTAFFHGGLTPNDKDILYLPFFAELVAAALLPTFAIFLVAILNTSVSLFFLYDVPHTPAFSAMLASSASSITFRLVEIHFFVTLVVWIVATWTLISVKQANRATELARLEHDLHVEAQETLKQKEHVERSIAEIVQVHTSVANGNVGARVHLTGENVFWQIAVPLNNLLGRYQQATRAAQERDLYLAVLNDLIQEYPTIRGTATRHLHEQRLLSQGQARALTQ